MDGCSGATFRLRLLRLDEFRSIDGVLFRSRALGLGSGSESTHPFRAEPFRPRGIGRTVFREEQMTSKSKRGFASMNPDRQREIASKGGRAAHAKGTAHEWSKDEARNAGKKGGEVVSRDRAHMAAIGREGGEARGRSTARTRGPAFSDRESMVVLSREGMPESGVSADRPQAQQPRDEATR